MSDNDRKQRFAAAFPWWEAGKALHGWTLEVAFQPGVEEVRRGGILLSLKHDPEKDSGNIRIHMPGATKEQIDAVQAWVVKEYEFVHQPPLRRGESSSS